MTREEVIRRLCALATEVGPRLNPLHAHDCFCGENELSGTDAFNGFQFNEEIVEFIENVTREAMWDLPVASKRPGHPKF